jgi:hypothetical protein
MRSPRIAEVSCVLVVSILGYGAVFAQQSELSSAALANPVAAQSLDELSATLNRPLFSPGRRPPAPPPPPPVVQTTAPPAPPPSRPDLMLLGVVMDGEGARAVIRTGGNKKILRAQIGDDIDGWKVSQIEGRKVVLSLDGRFATFTLFSGDRERLEAPGGSMPGVGQESSKQQGEAQQVTAQTAEATSSGQPIRRRRSR